jgi:hypothetical protein
LADDDEIISLELEGHPAPKGGGFSGELFTPFVLNERGQVAFPIGLTGGASSSGVFRADRFKTEAIALQGAPAPGTTGTFDSFLTIAISDSGLVALAAKLTVGVGDVDPTNNLGNLGRNLRGRSPSLGARR